MYFIALAFLLTLVASAPVPEGDNELERRAQCNSDNVLRALQHRTPDSYAFCSSYVSQPAVTTVTVYTETYTGTYTQYSTYSRHPAVLYNLQRWDPTQTPITYSKTSPSPSTVPGGALNYPPYKPQKRENMERAATTTPPPSPASTIPSYLATVPPSRISSGCSCLSPPYATTITEYDQSYVQVTQTCTTYPASSTTTLPAFCAASLVINSPSAPTNLARLNITTPPPFTTPTKLSCCAACADIFNCVFWKFSFAHPFTNGSGDPWAPGACSVGFRTEFEADTDWLNTAAVCPNEKKAVVENTYGAGSGKLERPGWNQGACGGVVGEFQSGQDFGWPVGSGYQELSCPAGE